jgi:hypothetical protein
MARDAYDEPADRGAAFDSPLPVSCARDAAGGRISAERDGRIRGRGLTAVPQCKSSGPGSDAPCAAPEAIGLETTDPGTVFDRLYDPTFGAGRANALLICLGNNCADCLP